MLNHQSILVTGGTGSFGKALVRRILRDYRPKRLVIFSRDEQKQFQMARELSPADHPSLRYFIGDVRDEKRLSRAMEGIDYVVHAAAMKHVPIAEYNPFECIRTNIGGAENVINAAIDRGVKRVIALSTDKAANPVNLYGATKLASDKCFVAANHLAASTGTRFSVVRYGNVMGSRGSVIEHFRKLVAEGATELPVTDRRMTRFWITLSHGVSFVLDRLGEMSGGEIFVPKIPTMGVADLARAIAPGCKIREIGIRPGEKLHEVLIPFDESRNTLEFSQHYTVFPPFKWWRVEDHMFDQGEEGARVGLNFQYRSNNSAWRLKADELRRLLAEEEANAHAEAA
ncbi:MAG TPA: UDP-N-acetylglucosamine 4,6-dehydratase (inverting) [Planctomycetes bacterium]|nr:UDP-N-acetylglucosamine 4,6-dehydratase (inverting) [Planctomycetota bacterium]